MNQNEVSEMENVELQRLIEERAIDRWQERWSLSDRGRVTFRFIPNVGDAIRLEDWQFSLQEGFLLSGHARINGHQYARGLVDDPGCICGADREDAVRFWCFQYFLCDCGAYERFHNLKGLSVWRKEGSWRLCIILATAFSK